MLLVIASLVIVVLPTKGASLSSFITAHILKSAIALPARHATPLVIIFRAA